MASVVKQRPTKNQLMDMLARPTAFVEALMATDGADIKLDPWQAHYLDNKDDIQTSLEKSCSIPSLLQFGIILAK